jgi:hypothetical protein
MLASGTTLISHFGVSFADAGERSAEISLQIRVIEQIPNTHFTDEVLILMTPVYLHFHPPRRAWGGSYLR